MKIFPSISFIQRVVILFGVVFGLGYANGLNAQYFSPSNYPDSEYPYALPPASLSLPYSNVNSYAYYWDPATVFDVMTWDDADMYTSLGTSLKYLNNEKYN